MLYLTNERFQMLDGLLANIGTVAEAIQQAPTSAAPILDYVATARAMLAAERDRGDNLATVNVDTPGMTALRDLVEWAGDAPIADVRAKANATGSTLSRGKAQWVLVAAAVIQLVYPDDVAPAPDVVIVPDSPATGVTPVEAPPAVVEVPAVTVD